MGAICRAGTRARRRALSTRETAVPTQPWPVTERRATPRELHGEVPEPGGGRLVCVCLPTTAAVVIGSAQPASDFSHERLVLAGLELVRRRSGGGAVLVAPGLQVWLDLFVPTGDALFHSDINKSFHWLGEIFADGLANVLATTRTSAHIEVNLGPLRKSPWSKVLCFAGLGAGEVVVEGRKVVGISQRRDRTGAWFHAMALLGARGGDLAEMLSGTPLHRSQAKSVLGESGLVGAEHLIDPLTQELLSRLP